MTELEKRLMDALKELSALWEADQEQQLESADSMHALDEGSQAVGQRLREASRATFERLAGAGAAARKAGGYLDEAIRTHHSGLQGDRRSVEKGLNRIRQIIQQRQRGPDRDYGPSR